MINHKFHDDIIRAYDIRGTYGKTLFNLDAKILGNVFGMTVGFNKTVNVCFDGRKSSLDLKESLINGLIDVGVNVNEIGLGPTPLMYFSCFHTKSNAGVMVTGSHNPKDHNGFKIVLNNAPFYGDDLKELSKRAKKFSLPKTKKGIRKKLKIENNYLTRLFQDFKQKKKISIVWDAGNGSAGSIMKKMSERIIGKKKYCIAKLMATFLIITLIHLTQKI